MLSSEICTNTLPLSCSSSFAINSRSRRYVRYECSPSFHVSRYAFTISGSRVMSSSGPCFTSRLRTNGWKLEPNFTPYGGGLVVHHIRPALPSNLSQAFVPSRQFPQTRLVCP